MRCLRARIRFSVVVGGAVLTVWALGGCREPLLRADEPRSQFDRYDVVREQQAAPFLRDEFGRLRPNLRGRLLPPD
ncbi:MAG: hypothetical protein AAGI17_05385 [Planctomycetota bacterium]